MPEAKRAISAVDLFSGCGALSLGLRKSGFSVVAAVEINPRRAKTFALNHPDTLLLSQDIRTVSVPSLLTSLGRKAGEIDLVAGCPPCQGFSRIRRRNGKTAVADARNDLVAEFARVVLEIRPRAVMMENVPGLERDKRFRSLLRTLRGAGYKIGWSILNLKDFGVPQRRRRLVLIGWRGGSRPTLNTIVKARPKTVRDAIETLPHIPKALRPLHYYRTARSSEVRQRIRRVPRNGGSRSELPETLGLKCHGESDGFKDVYGRLAWDAPAPTITGGCINPSKGRFLHPTRHRAITLIEAARLQSFPIWYKFDPTIGRYPIAEMIGEALPPAFAAAAGRFIATRLRLAV